VAVLATGNQALTGLSTPLDGYTLQEGSRVLLVGQTDTRENGVWAASAGAWSRATDADAIGEVPLGTVWQVANGTQYRNTYWRFNSPEGFNPGTNSVTITQIPTVTRNANARPVRVVATSNQTLSSLYSIDGVSLTSGDRVLLTAQTDGTQNGAWVAGDGTWSRASTENETIDMPVGTTWIVREGSANAWTTWRLDNQSSYVLNTSPLTINKTTAPWKAVVTTSAVALSGLQTINGVTLTAGDWILVTARGTTADGIYRIASGSWERVPMYQETFDIRAWTLKHSDLTDGDRIASMKNVSRKMADLSPTFHARVADTATFYSPQTGSCTANAQCTSAPWCNTGTCWCGLDNICYRPAFRTLRLGFTNGQGTRDQDIDIKDFVTTWLP
jgi:phage-related tail fiber protein